MIPWIESQTTVIIAIMTFAFCYLIAAVILAAAFELSRHRIAINLKATTPVMLTPLSVIAGLLIAFLASHVWANLDHATNYLDQEASALQEATLLADTLPSSTQTALRTDIRSYLQFVENQEWPEMETGHASLRRSPPGIPDAVRTLVSFVPTQQGQIAAQSRAILALMTALEARRNRILLSEATIEPIQWTVIILLLVLVLVTIAKVHIDRPTTAAGALFVFSTAMAACLILLLVNDRPFAAGGFTLQPTALEEVRLAQ